MPSREFVLPRPPRNSSSVLALLRVAQQLMAAEPSSYDSLLNELLRISAQELEADRVYLFNLGSDRALPTHEYKPAETSTLMGAVYQRHEVEMVFDAADREVSLFVDLSGPLAPEYAVEEALFREEGLHALLLTPFGRTPDSTRLLDIEWTKPRTSISEEELGFVAEVVATLQAAAELERRERSQLQLNARLSERQRLEAIGMLAGGIAHDFNNVLQAVLGIGEALLEPSITPVQSTQLTTTLLDVAERAAAVPSRLLALSRQEVRQRSLVPVYSVLACTAQLLKRTIPENRRLVMEASQDLGSIFASHAEFEQVLINLCNNAVQAMPNGGIVKLSARVAPDDPDVVVIEVVDTGVGMSESQLAKACEPFFTTKATGEGTGLGLYMVRQTVEATGGSMQIRSQLDAGTTVTLRIPLSHETATEVAALDPKLLLGSETVLLVEDDPLIRRVSHASLTQAGYVVFSTGDGASALRCYQDNESKIDAVVTDVVMPTMMGHELFQAIRAANPDMPFVFVSGYDPGTLQSETVGQRRTTFLQKPYRMSKLLLEIRNLLADKGA